MDVCGVHSVHSVYEVSGLVAFVGPMGRWDWTLVAFTALIAFMGIGVGCLGHLQHLFYLWSVWVRLLGRSQHWWCFWDVQAGFLLIYFSCGVAC